MKKIFGLFIGIILSIGCAGEGIVTGGYTQPSTTQTSPTIIKKVTFSQQLIIKFRPNTIECNAAGIAQLSSTTHVSLEFVRTMSGEACVVRQFADSAEGLLNGQEILKQYPAVEYLEPDAVMKAL